MIPTRSYDRQSQSFERLPALGRIGLELFDDFCDPVDPLRCRLARCRCPRFRSSGDRVRRRSSDSNSDDDVKNGCESIAVFLSFLRDDPGKADRSTAGVVIKATDPPDSAKHVPAVWFSSGIERLRLGVSTE